MKIFFRELIDVPLGYAKYEIEKIDFCCEDMKWLYKGGFNIEKEKDKFYLDIDIDSTDDYVINLPIEFRYCPYCGEKIEFIQEGDNQ
jgi:hypothetical protein